MGSVTYSISTSWMAEEMSDARLAKGDIPHGNAVYGTLEKHVWPIDKMRTNEMEMC